MQHKEYDIAVTSKKKRIYLNTQKTKYCWVLLFNYQYDMNEAYKKYCKDGGEKRPHYVQGAHTPYHLYSIGKNGRRTLRREIATIYLCVDHCGAGVVSHEFNHAVLYTWNRDKKQPQYPIIIKNMKEEEQLLHNHTFAVMQFYQWFYKIAKRVKNEQ